MSVPLPEPLTLAVMLAGLAAAALARGYSGFGFSALLVSSWSLVTEPVRAVALALVLEVAASVLQARSVWRLIPWRRVALLLTGALLGTPAGVWLLAHAPAQAMRLGIGVFVSVAALTLLAGLRLRRAVGETGTASVGVISGVANGAVAMGGLPVALFLTAAGDRPERIRAASIAYFFLLDLIALLFLARQDLVGAQTLVEAAFALPVVAAGLWLGGRRFLGASPEGFRRATLCLLSVLGAVCVARSL